MRAGLFFVACCTLLACMRGEERRNRTLAAVAEAERQGDLERAAALLEQACALDPRDAGMVTRRAEVELARERPEAALRVLRSLPGDVPEIPELRRVRARALLHCSACPEGLRLAIALSRSGGGAEALAEEAIRAVVGSWERCSAQLADLPAPWLPRLTARLLAAREPMAALEVWCLLPEADSERDRLGDRIVAALLRLPPSDLQSTCPAILRPPLSPQKLELSFRSALAGGRWRDAAEAEKTFARLFPSASPSYEMLVAIARRDSKRGNFQQALAQAGRALDLRPDGVEALVERGLALQALGRGGEADATFAAVLALDPDNAVARRFVPQAVAGRAEEPLGGRAPRRRRPAP